MSGFNLTEDAALAAISLGVNFGDTQVVRRGGRKHLACSNPAGLTGELVKHMRCCRYLCMPTMEPDGLLELQVDGNLGVHSIVPKFVVDPALPAVGWRPSDMLGPCTAST